VAGSYEHGTEPSSSLKGDKFLEYLSECQETIEEKLHVRLGICEQKMFNSTDLEHRWKEQQAACWVWPMKVFYSAYRATIKLRCNILYNLNRHFVKLNVFPLTKSSTIYNVVSNDANYAYYSLFLLQNIALASFWVRKTLETLNSGFPSLFWN
jgi:hypothetical protein